MEVILTAILVIWVLGAILYECDKRAARAHTHTHPHPHPSHITAIQTKEDK